MGMGLLIVPIIIVGIIAFFLLLNKSCMSQAKHAVDTGRSLRIFQDKETGVCKRTNEECVMDYVICNGFGAVGIGPTCGNCVFATRNACQVEGSEDADDEQSCQIICADQIL